MSSEEHESPVRAVLRLALPAVAYSILQTLIFIADRAMLGHHSQTSLAAMQIAGPLEWSLWSIFMALEVGTLARVGFHLGAKEFARARALAKTAIVLSLGVGVLVALATPALLPLLPSFAPLASGEVIQRAGDYLSWTLSASPIMFVGLAIGAVFQGLNDTRTPLIAAVLANVIHVPLNYVLIFGGFGIPALGVTGCGISSAVTFLLETLLLLFALGVRLREFEGTPPARTIRERDLRELFRVSGPAFLERFVYHAGFTAFISMITRLGETAMAANQALISLESLCFLTADGIGIAAASLVAQRLGAHSRKGAIACARAALFMGIGAMFALGAFLALGRDLLLPIFTKDADVSSLARSIMPFFMFAEPLLAFASVLGQSLRGAGYTRDALLATLVSAVGVRIAATWYLALHLHLGLIGIWFGSTTDWLVRSCILLFFVRKRTRAWFTEDGKELPSPS